MLEEQKTWENGRSVEYTPSMDELKSQVKWLNGELQDAYKRSERLAKQYEILLDYIINKEKLADSERRCDAMADDINRLYDDNWKLSAELEKMKTVTCDSGCKPPSFNTSTCENVYEVSATNYPQEGCCMHTDGVTHPLR